MKNLFIRLFFFAVIAASFALLAFTIYVAYRRFTHEPHPFDASYIHHVRPAVIFITMAICLSGIVLAWIGNKMLNNENKWYLFILILSWLVCAFSIYFINGFIHRVEWVYTLKSPYYKLFLATAFPLAMAMLLGLTGVIMQSFKREPANPFTGGR